MVKNKKFKIAISDDLFTAYSDIPKKKQPKVLEFIYKFRNNPDSSGINYEKIKNAYDKNLRSVRIDDTYRGIVLKPDEGNVYMLLWIDLHDDAYKWAMRKRCTVNPETQAIQVYEVLEGEEIELRKEKEDYLFDKFKDKDLRKIGVNDETIGIVRAIKNDKDLEKNMKYLSKETYEALVFLDEGFTLEEVIRDMQIDDVIADLGEEDFGKALDKTIAKSRFIVIDNGESEKELKDMLNAPLEKWRVFLHPSQRKLVKKQFNGPARVLGGAGTGKTVVAMHRAKWLVENDYNNPDDRILFTTFTTNLAYDIGNNLNKICSRSDLERIEVVNLDRWVVSFLNSQGYKYRIIYGDELDELWDRAMAVSSDDLDLPVYFYKEEWSKVIKPQEIYNLNDYIKASRIGRGKKLNRKDRKEVWSVFEEFKIIMDDEGVRDSETAMIEARIILENKPGLLIYKSIVIDEGQDFSTQAYKLLRNMAGKEHKNDIFIVGDSQQRIYGRKFTLSKCGVNIVGRGSKLKINYRTTEEIRNWAIKILEGKQYDDFDGGVDDSKGYKSLLHGMSPEIKHFKNFSEEVKFIKSYINELLEGGVNLSNICCAVRNNRLIEDYKAALNDVFKVYELKFSKNEELEKEGLRLSSMHRVKGLEFDYVILPSVNEGIIPSESVMDKADDTVTLNEVELSERSLLYVAATRAKKSILITSYGNRSRFIVD